MTVAASRCTIADCRVQPLKSRTLFASQRLKQSTSAQGDMSIQLSHSPNILANLCNSIYQCELLAVLMLVSLINWKLEVILQTKHKNCVLVYHFVSNLAKITGDSGHDAPAHPLAKLCATSGGVPSVKGSMECCGVAVHVVWKMDLIMKHTKTCHLSPIHDGILKVAIELNSET